MGKPAARLGDMTAHGGSITGPGCPTVLIGGMPAACLGDMHVCPMVTPAPVPVPHVGGPISGPGCPTVLIGGRPAATMGDLCVCVGPPSSIVLGCPTVLIGMAGGGGGGSGNSAAGSDKTIKGLEAGTIKAVKGSESLPIKVQAVILEASKHLSPEETDALVENSKKKAEEKKITIADFVEILKAVENEQGKEAARFYASTLDYSALSDLARAFTSGEDTDKKNDPNQMPTRFMVLYGSDDAKLQSIDDHPDKFDKEDHKMNVANLRKALRLMGHDIKESGPYNDEVYAAHFTYLGEALAGQGPYQEKHTVVDGEDLGSIARKYGLASWKYLYEQNKKAVGDNPDLLKSGTELKIPKWDNTTGDEKLKAKGAEPESWAGGVGYRYPWVAFSFSLGQNNKRLFKAETYKKAKTCCIRNELDGTILAKHDLSASDDFEMLIPDCQNYEIEVDGMLYS